ncbi:MAG: ATP-binding protein [Trebonia sp.]|jgi:serine/threonine-protein kinase RsbW|uniref:ATP-binding protein n=2 Tax=Trebonia sp. TaxID=2767075 RepID=UPI003BB02A04
MSDQGRYGHACHGRTGAARRHLQLTLPACGQPVRLARQVTREVLAAWRLAHVEETAVLLVSELVTNAVRDAASTSAITLELQVVHTWLRIEAYRCPPGPAMPRTTGESDQPGSGFALVDCLAGKWAWIAWPARGEVRETLTGETAWAELDVHGEPGLQPR